MKDKELPLQAVYTVVPCFFSLLFFYILCDLTFYHYLIKILLQYLGVLKSFPIFAVLFIDILFRQQIVNKVITFKT